MKRFVIIPLILFISFWATVLNADIYTWTDENGVQHYTNIEPPKQAKLMIKSAQFATDEKAAQERIDAVRLERKQLELQEVAEKQTLISMKQQAIEEQLEEADRKAEEALKRSEEKFDDAPGFNGGYDDFRDGGDDVVVTGTTYGYYPYYYYPYYSYRSHFKHRGGRHFRKQHLGRFGKNPIWNFNKHRIGNFHHGKDRHAFIGKGHHSRGNFRGGHSSRGNFQGGHRRGRR